MIYKTLALTLLSTALFLSCASAPQKEADAQEAPDQVTKHQMEEGKRKVNDYIGSGPLGSQNNPIKCSGMQGIQSYLTGLRGPEKQRLQYGEPQDMGIGPFESLIYMVQIDYLSGGKPVQAQLFFDPDFEEYREIKPAAGFKLEQ